MRLDRLRTLTEPTAGPLFASESDDDDLASGTIYVLRSKSEHPLVAAHRDVLHKIGVRRGGDGHDLVGAGYNAIDLFKASIRLKALPPHRSH